MPDIRFNDRPYSISNEPLTENEVLLFNTAMDHHVRSFNEDAKRKGKIHQAYRIGDCGLEIATGNRVIKGYKAYFNADEDSTAPALIFETLFEGDLCGDTHTQNRRTLDD